MYTQKKHVNDILGDKLSRVHAEIHDQEVAQQEIRMRAIANITEEDRRRIGLLIKGFGIQQTIAGFKNGSQWTYMATKEETLMYLSEITNICSAQLPQLYKINQFIKLGLSIFTVSHLLPKIPFYHIINEVVPETFYQHLEMALAKREKERVAEIVNAEIDRIIVDKNIKTESKIRQLVMLNIPISEVQHIIKRPVKLIRAVSVGLMNKKQLCECGQLLRQDRLNSENLDLPQFQPSDAYEQKQYDGN